MSDKKDTTHIVIDKELIVYQRERSTIWQCRYCIDRQWQRTSTKEYDLGKAKKKAKELFLEAQFRKRNDIAPITRYFKDIAKSVVKKLKQEIASGNGKAIYKDYISAITNYFIPALGKYYVDSIDYKALEELDKYRVKKLQAQPTRSTLLTHNAALSKVLDEAIYKGYMLASRKPELKAKGKKSERRTEFTRVEATAIKANFDEWISIHTRKHSTRNRALLMTTYLSGMRVGEISSLQYKDVVDAEGSIRNEIRLSAEQTKGNEARIVFVSDKLRKELEIYAKLYQPKNINCKFFYSQKTDSDGFTANTLTQFFHYLYKRCGIYGASSHSGRRTFITNLANKGISVRVLASLAGHKNISTTQCYIDVNDDMKRKAVELI